jgi:hypothetical protein
MHDVWSKIAPILPMAADVVLVLVAIILVGLLVSPFLMRSARAGSRIRNLGCFFYSAGLWLVVRGLIGGLGLALGLAVYLWEKGKDSGTLKKSTEDLLNTLSVAWLITLICAIGLLGLLGDKLRKLSEKHHEIAREGFRKLFASRVPSSFPDGLDNNAPAVLAYHAVWTGCFNAPSGNIDGWKLSDLRERLRLIYFSPSVTVIQPPTAAVNAQASITGSGFTEARAVHFGSAPATMTINSDTNITVTVPPGSGAVPLMVIGKNRVRSSPSSFTYATPPAPPTP